MPDAERIEVLCKGDVLGREMNLNFIRRTRWVDTDEDLLLNYRLKTNERKAAGVAEAEAAAAAAAAAASAAATARGEEGKEQKA